MAAIESPLAGAIGMSNEIMPAPSAGAPRQQGGGHAPSPHLNPLQFGKDLLGGGGGEGAAAGGAEAAGAGAALEELAPLALLAL